MRRAVVATPLAAITLGCASPFDQRWNDGGDAGATRGELPRWVVDEWRGKPSPLPGVGASNNDVQPSPAQPQSLDDLIIWALENNPSVQAAEARWHAARHRIVQARTLPEPELSYRVIVDQVETDQTPIGHAVGISQMFPWFGTLERAAEVEAAEARAAAQRYVKAQLTVAGAIRTAWTEYVYLHQVAAVQEEQLELLQQLESVVRSRFRAGEVGQRDLVRVEAEIDRSRNDLRDAEEMITAAAARVNAAVGRASGAPLPEAPALPELVVDIDVEKLFERLKQANPSLEGLRHELAARREAQRLAGKQFYPDIMLGFEYGIDTARRMARMDGGGSDMFMGMVGLRLPIWRDSYQAGVREAMAEWGATLRELENRQNTLEAELHMSIYNIRDAQRRMELFGDRLRIRAEQVLKSTITAYRAQEAGFTDLIDAQRELLEFSLAAHRAEADRFRAVARIEELVGKAFAPVTADADNRTVPEELP